MKPWAEKFYNSPAWKRCRKTYTQSKHGLCERCGEVGEIVHHIKHITPENIDDPKITLSYSNLQLLCRSCHGYVHGLNATREGYSFDAEGNLVYTPLSCNAAKGD